MGKMFCKIIDYAEKTERKKNYVSKYIKKKKNNYSVWFCLFENFKKRTFLGMYYIKKFKNQTITYKTGINMIWYDIYLEILKH